MIANAVSKIVCEQYKVIYMPKSINDILEQISSAIDQLSASSITVSENQNSLN